MKLAYLLNSYPMTSTTFIRREIEAIEALGQPVTRFSVRHWDTALVDPDDIAEQKATEYLLTGNINGLFLSGLRELFVNPGGLLRTLPLWAHCLRVSDAGLIKHFNYLLQAIHLRRRARALQIDHIHAHFSTNATTVAMLAHSLGGPSFSFTVHGPDELLDPPSNAIRRKIERAAFVAAITGYCKARLESEAPGEGDKIRIIPCGLALADFSPRPMPARDARHFVCIGRLCANKAQELIPEAVARLKREFPDIVIDLIGDGEHRTRIEEAIRRHGLEQNVRLLGWAAAPIVRERISASDGLILASLAEGLPIVIMEALALERPVLTTMIAGIPELVDDGCGWIFPAGSVEALADNLRLALSASAEERLAKAKEGRRRIEARHDIKRSAQLLLDGFRAAVARRKAA